MERAQRGGDGGIGETGQQSLTVCGAAGTVHGAAADRLDQQHLEQPVQHQASPGSLGRGLVADQIEHGAQARGFRIRRSDFDETGEETVEQRRVGVVKPEMAAEQFCRWSLAAAEAALGDS